jgi:hypothetical protein
MGDRFRSVCEGFENLLALTILFGPFVHPGDPVYVVLPIFGVVAKIRFARFIYVAIVLEPARLLMCSMIRFRLITPPSVYN